MPDLAPPTPPIPLPALLAYRDLGLRQVAGPPADEVAVHWVHTSEMGDPYPYLLGGELLLSAGVHFAEAADVEAHLDFYVSRIVEAGAAALGFGLAPVHDAVPDALAAACDRHGLPLLEVPPQTTFTAIARAVWRLMAEARTHELRRVTQAQQGLATAAARPDPVPSVLRQLAARVGGWTVLLAPDGTELQATDRPPSAGARAALVRLARVVTPAPPRAAPSSATDTAGGAHLAAYALGGSEGLVLGVATGGREPGDHTIAGVAAVLLSLLTAPHQGADAAGRSAALVRLLLGAAPEEVAPLLGRGPWWVVHARGGEQGASGNPLAASALGAALGSALVDAEDSTVRIVTDREVTPQPGWVLGVSAPAAAADLDAADTQAHRALRRAEASRADLVRHREADLTALVAPDEARAHARTRLAPIADSPALTETLRGWLSLHGSWDRTAVSLGVHRNTVRQRIARCAALLDADLDDPDVRMELWFALRWL
ncbi:PucR family transcriptional regulator [Streptomyces sp. A3M-1-3]|uniref:PucR family transcriptional regulator n=1 Tax=Streptomyces sp. A3M-1-3 TaxID=2962044 RepID=UPI0020B63FB7|nr:PucR family transcriptional regulator [Streptomyces sp. A3M-1-3]MCP3819590.1 PucR family transcriptional regulator [Streptomyces sp. A3M-1-3]